MVLMSDRRPDGQRDRPPADQSRFGAPARHPPPQAGRLQGLAGASDFAPWVRGVVALDSEARRPAEARQPPPARPPVSCRLCVVCLRPAAGRSSGALVGRVPRAPEERHGALRAAPLVGTLAQIVLTPSPGRAWTPASTFERP